VSFTARLGAAVLLLLAACLESFELPDSGLADAGTGGSAGGPGDLPSCGEDGAACCAPDEGPACGAELRCDLDTGVCVQDEPRLCTSAAQCHPGQTCCLSGLLGSCESVPADGVCPTADLALMTTQETLGFSLEQRIFSPETSAADACAIEKGCVGGPGLRHLLRFSIEVENQGAADLLIGDPETSDRFVTAACDGRPYLPNYLSYQLVDIAGREVQGASGHAQARQDLPPGFSPRFNCEFWGLWSGFAETFFPNAPQDADDPAAVDCQWIDVTGVAEGDYVLRVRVDPDNTLGEPDGGNVRDFNVTIPALDAPTRTCPLISDTEVNWTGGSSLYADGLLRECGWSIVPTALDARCVPGESVTLTCPGCAAESEPMLRVCEGTQSCVARAALASGYATFTLLDDTNGVVSDQLSGDECFARLAAEPSRYSACYASSECPTARFTCPASGAYTAFSAASAPNATAACEATPQQTSTPDAGP
jgi:hypothetical protein